MNASIDQELRDRVPQTPATLVRLCGMHHEFNLSSPLVSEGIPDSRLATLGDDEVAMPEYFDAI